MRKTIKTQRRMKKKGNKNSAWKCEKSEMKNYGKCLSGSNGGRGEGGGGTVHV